MPPYGGGQEYLWTKLQNAPTSRTCSPTPRSSPAAAVRRRMTPLPAVRSRRQAAKKVTVVDIRFRNNAKNYFFDPGELTIATGDHVIMDTSRGVEYGVCAAGNHEVPASEIVPPLRKVLRLATPQDEHVNAANLEKEKRAFDVCLQKIAEHKLEMQLVSAECAFDGSKLLFFFTADGRVDMARCAWEIPPQEVHHG